MLPQFGGYGGGETTEHLGIRKTFLLTGSFIKEQVKIFVEGKERKLDFRPSLKRPREEIFVYLNTPPLGWIKLNTDGMSWGNPVPAGGAGIFRTPVAGFKRAFSIKCGICSSVKA